MITECIESQKPLKCFSLISKKFFWDFHAVMIVVVVVHLLSTYPYSAVSLCVCRLCRALGAFVFLSFTFHLWNGKRMSTSQGRFIFHNTDYFLSHHCTLFLSLSLSLHSYVLFFRFCFCFAISFERRLGSLIRNTESALITEPFRPECVWLYFSNRKIILCLYNEMMPGFSFF